MAHITSARIRKIENLCRRYAASLRREHGQMARAQVKKISQREAGTEFKENITKDLLKDLAESYPQDGFYHNGNELKTAKDAGYTWHFNMLGGFENFLRGREDIYQIFVLTKEGKPIECFGYNPLSDQICLAVLNNGATGYETRLRVSGRKTLEESCIHLSGLSPDFMCKLQDSGASIRITGSALTDILDVCSGRADGLFAQDFPLTESLFASLMIAESGGNAISLKNNKDFIGANFHCFSQLKKLLS